MTNMTMERLVADASQDDADGLLQVGGVVITREEIADVDLFLSGDRGKAWFAALTGRMYFSRWYNHQRGPYELDWCSKIADEILDMKRAGACPGEIETMIEGHFSGGQDADDAYYEEHNSDVENTISGIAADLSDMREDDPTIPEMDEEEWKERLRDDIIDHLNENDDSSVMDMFGSYDRCEIMVKLGDGDLIHSNRPWADFSDLAIDESLQSALGAIGYTVGDYRRMSGNRGESRNLRRNVKRRPQPIIDEKEFRSIVEEACSTSFNLVLYAVVALRDLVELDLGKPFSLGHYSVASYDAANGTYYDVDRKEAITISPGDGELTTPWGYSPVSICCMSTGGYATDIANVD